MDIDPRLCSSATAQSQSQSQPQPQPPSQPRPKPSDSQAYYYPDPPTSIPRTGPGSGSGSGTSTYYSPQQQVYANSALGPDPNDPNELKRPRACEACRQLKVRCEPDSSHPAGSCKRCAKAGRNCVVTAPTRKRQKKTDTRVAELERKIDALTASLQAQGEPVTKPVPVQTNEENPGRRWLGAQDQANGSLAGRKRASTGEVKESSTAVYGSESETHPAWNQHQPPESREPDLIDKGLVDVATATAAFDRYVSDMAPQIPFVVFPAGTKMEDIRRTKPILLHSIIAVAIGPILPSSQLTLMHEFYKVIAERVVMRGEKSLELVQALSVNWIWYLPPEHFEELKFYQVVHMAVVMGMDIGMNRKMINNRKPFNLIRDLLGKKPSSLNPDSPETRRTWLGCYFGSVQVSSALRRVILVRWQSYMDECLEILENSPDALPSDKTLIHLIKLTHLLEEVGFQFSTDDPESTVSFSDPKVQYTLKAFEKQLIQWKKELPPETYSPVMQQSEHILNIYMHETALQLEASQTDEESSGPMTAAHINALTSCLTSIHLALDTICSVEIRSMICLPTAALARTSYAVVALIKLYSLASTPDTKVGQVIDPTSLKVEYYLDKVTSHYKTASEQDGGRALSKFSSVMNLLRSWFIKQKDRDPALREAFGTFSRPIICSDENDGREVPAKTTTPLQLLSEVAMGNQSRPGTTLSRPYAPDSEAPNQPPGESDMYSQYPPVPGLSTPSTTSQSQQRQQYYQPYNQSYQDMLAGTAPHYTESSAVNPNASEMMMSNQTSFVPELGMQVGFYPENLFALGNMLDEGFFYLPFGGIDEVSYTS